MTQLQKILLLIIGALFLLYFILVYFICGSLAHMDWKGMITLPLLLVIIPACVVSFLICAIRGKYDNAYQLLVWTHALGLVISLAYTIDYVAGKVYTDYKELNREIVNDYRHSFGDGRDEMISLAIDALAQKPELKDGFGIHSLGVDEKDTVVNGEMQQYCAVKLIYFTGEQFTKEQAYTCQYHAYYNKNVTEI